jgi:hypothetical protein
MLVRAMHFGLRLLSLDPEQFDKVLQALPVVV